jgi:hypothetical protein
MGRWFVPFFVGLTVVGIGIFGVLYMNRGSHVELQGEILKVRTIADGDGTIVFADFRVTNAAAIPFVVSSVKMTMEISVDDATPAVVFSKSDVEKATKYLKVLGPKHNEVLSIKDELPPVETVDRVAAGRFPFPAKSFQQGKNMKLRIQEADGRELTGEILKVRNMDDGDGTIVFADFRVTNKAANPFVVSSVELTMEIPMDEVATAVVFSKSDVEKVTTYLKVLGPKYNDVLSIKDKLPPVETVDRMAAGRFAFPPKLFQQRKTLRLRIEEVDGAASEIVEKSAAK